jgi:hypothetical protein
MNADQIFTQKKALMSNVFVYERGIPILPEEFLHCTWEVLSNFVHFNKRDPLIQKAVRAYPDLIPRAYFIVTTLFGAFSLAPSERDILKEFVEMLDDDLDEKELRTWEYTKDKKNGFFPRLFPVMPLLREIYGAKHYSQDVLPHTVYQAYAMFVLNHGDKIERGVSQEELFGILAVCDSQFKQIFRLVGHPTPQK